MIAIGILLILLIAFLTVAVVLGGGETATLDTFNVEVTTSLVGFFAIGAAAAIVAVIGLWLVVAGISRSRRREREMERLRRQADSAAARERAAEQPSAEGAAATTTATATTGAAPGEPGDLSRPESYEAAAAAGSTDRAPGEEQPAHDPYARDTDQFASGEPAPIPDQPTSEREDQRDADRGPAHR